MLYHHQPLLLIHIGKEGANTLDIAKRKTRVTGGQVKMGLAVIGFTVQLWGLKIKLNCYNVHIPFTDSIILIFSEFCIIPSSSLES